MTLALPEASALYKRFKAHKVRTHIGTVGVECCCLFSVATRAPIAYAIGVANTSDHRLIVKLKRRLKKTDLLLIDGGFYSFELFRAILSKSPFVIPMDRSGKPLLTETLAKGDYRCQIRSSRTKEEMNVRVIYAYRNGFRRRRLVTSLLDPTKYPAKAIVQLYHSRWTIETFYNDFKNTMQGNRWHCHSPHSFEIELTVKMIFTCLIRLTMAEAAKEKGILPPDLSFCRALTETRLFLKRVVAHSFQTTGLVVYRKFITECGRYLNKAKPGRSFPRDKQIYRRKARGLEKRKVGRPPTKHIPKPLNEPEIITDWKNTCYLLS